LVKVTVFGGLRVRGNLKRFGLGKGVRLTGVRGKPKGPGKVPGGKGFSGLRKVRLGWGVKRVPVRGKVG